MNVQPIDKSRLAKNGYDYLQLVKGDADWIVRTAQDLRDLRSLQDGPLAKLPDIDFEAFVSGLEFKLGGVGGGTYKPLMAHLSLSEIYQVFARFGMSEEYARETHDAKCVSNQCETTIFSFCPSSVCHDATKEA